MVSYIFDECFFRNQDTFATIGTGNHVAILNLKESSKKLGLVLRFCDNFEFLVSTA